MKSNNGFTLVELIVVIAIIAILASIGASIYTGARKNAQDARKKADVQAIAKAYETTYKTGTGYRPITGDDFATHTIPEPPDEGGYTGFINTTSPGYRVCAALSNSPTPTCNAPSDSCFCIDSQQGEYVAAATPTPGGATPTPLPSMTFPIRLAYYYPWYPQQWVTGHVYTPAWGEYNSSDSRVMESHLTWANYAHLDGFISSWHGPGDNTDYRLQAWLNYTTASAYPNFKWTLIYERESREDPTPEQIAADLSYMDSRLFNHPNWIRVNGKPVIFVYNGGSGGPAYAKRWADAAQIFGRDKIYYVLQIAGGGWDWRNDSNQPDSWHQYDPVRYLDAQMPYFIGVAPGFQKPSEAPRLERRLDYFETALQSMVTANANWQIILTFNEWNEGTLVEPATQFTNLDGSSNPLAYLQAMCRKLPGTTPC